MTENDTATDDEETPEEQAIAPSSAGLPEPPPLRETLAQAVRRVLFRSREEFGRAASAGRDRLEVRQLEKDRVHFWTRLGKEAYFLVEAGEIDHPALRRAMTRIDDLEASLREKREHVDASRKEE